jgi:hypothetical protein
VGCPRKTPNNVRNRDQRMRKKFVSHEIILSL